MTDQELNVKIAEACGWTYMPSNTRCGDWFYQELRKSQSAPPNFLYDLNASHEMEKALIGDKQDKYTEELSILVCGVAHFGSFHWGDIRKLRSATARQRAEAFAKVKGII